MAYADPQSVTVNAVAQSLARTGSGSGVGQFKTSDGVYTLDVSHSYGRRTRRTIGLTSNKISADPLIPSQNTRNNMRAYLVVDHPINGYTVAEQKYLVDALVAYLTASTGARVTQLLGGEN